MTRKQKKSTLNAKESSGSVLGFFRRNSMSIVFIVGFAVVGSYMIFSSQAATGNDLVVTDVFMSPANPAAGQNVSFSATIKNQGTTWTDGTAIGVGFSVDGQLVSWNRDYDNNLAPGDSTTLTANSGTDGYLWSATPGPHTLVATADDTNAIPDEINEANNSKSLTFTIGNTGSLYLEPASASVFIDDDVSLQLRLMPDTTVDGVEATVSYDPTLLQLKNINTDDSPFDLDLSQETSSGLINLTRGNLSGGVDTDSLIAEITFTALKGNGIASLGVEGNAATNGVYTDPTTQGADITLQTPDTTAPDVSITSPSEGEELFTQETVSVSAVDNVAVTKVELYIDGQLKGTDQTAPYRYTIDTETIANGTRELQAKAYDEAGNIGNSATVEVTIKNWAEDINQDGIVSLLDFSLLATKYGQTGSDLGREDINADGKVNLLDFSLLASRFGQ